MAEKLSNDVACGDDFTPDFSSEHVVKAVGDQDDDDVVSVVGGGAGDVEVVLESSRPLLGTVAASALPSASLEAASSPEGTPLTARKLFATPDPAMKVRQACSGNNLLILTPRIRDSSYSYSRVTEKPG